MTDAAFREALREYHSAAVEMATQIISADRWRDAEARVLALYAERQGEVYRVEVDESGSAVIYLSENHRPGQCVLVKEAP